MNTSKFTREIYNYAKLDDPSSAFILENYRDILQRQKDESKKLRFVAYALEHYEEKYPSKYGNEE